MKEYGAMGTKKFYSCFNQLSLNIINIAEQWHNSNNNIEMKGNNLYENDNGIKCSIIIELNELLIFNHKLLYLPLEGNEFYRNGTLGFTRHCYLRLNKGS
jgi:hypothetical protein